MPVPFKNTNITQAIHDIVPLVILEYVDGSKWSVKWANPEEMTCAHKRLTVYLYRLEHIQPDAMTVGADYRACTFRVGVFACKALISSPPYDLLDTLREVFGKPRNVAFQITYEHVYVGWKELGIQPSIITKGALDMHGDNEYRYEFAVRMDYQFESNFAGTAPA